MYTPLHAALNVFVVLMLAVSTASAGTPAQDADAALDRSLRGLVTMPAGPPGVIAVVQRGDQVRTYTAGYADVETKRRARATDHMRIASVAASRRPSRARAHSRSFRRASSRWTTRSRSCSRISHRPGVRSRSVSY